MSILSADEWDRFLEGYPNAHLLQTSAWGELKAQFGWQNIRIKSNDTGAQILFRKIPLTGRTVAYIPKGPVGRGLTPDFWSAVDQVCRRQKAIYLKAEPDLWEGLTDFDPDRDLSGFVSSEETIQPPQTILIDISGSEDEILERMKQKTRYNVHLAEKRGITVQPMHDLQRFHQMMKVTGGRDKFGVHSASYYQKAFELFHSTQRCEILAAEYEHKLLAALMVFKQGKRAWYMYGASSDEERNRMPTYLLQWEAMRWAKSNGCVEYDLWGIPDVPEAELEKDFTTRHDGLWGVYRFKRGFGGTLVRSVGAYDRVYHPILYQLYHIASGFRKGG